MPKIPVSLDRVAVTPIQGAQQSYVNPVNQALGEFGQTVQKLGDDAVKKMRQEEDREFKIQALTSLDNADTNTRVFLETAKGKNAIEYGDPDQGPTVPMEEHTSRQYDEMIASVRPQTRDQELWWQEQVARRKSTVNQATILNKVRATQEMNKQSSEYGYDNAIANLADPRITPTQIDVRQTAGKLLEVVRTSDDYINADDTGKIILEENAISDSVDTAVKSLIDKGMYRDAINIYDQNVESLNKKTLNKYNDQLKPLRDYVISEDVGTQVWKEIKPDDSKYADKWGKINYTEAYAKIEGMGLTPDQTDKAKKVFDTEDKQRRQQLTVNELAAVNKYNSAIIADKTKSRYPILKSQIEGDLDLDPTTKKNMLNSLDTDYGIRRGGGKGGAEDEALDYQNRNNYYTIREALRTGTKVKLADGKVFDGSQRYQTGHAVMFRGYIGDHYKELEKNIADKNENAGAWNLTDAAFKDSLKQLPNAIGFKEEAMNPTQKQEYEKAKAYVEDAVLAKVRARGGDPTKYITEETKKAMADYTKSVEPSFFRKIVGIEKVEAKQRVYQFTSADIPNMTDAQLEGYAKSRLGSDATPKEIAEAVKLLRKSAPTQLKTEFIFQ